MMSISEPLMNAIKGTLLSWGLTALGAAAVFFIPTNLDRKRERQLLDVCFGFAGGVMLAASFWSLLDPALEHTRDSQQWSPQYVWVPAAIGFVTGALFLTLCDALLGLHQSPETILRIELTGRDKKDQSNSSTLRVLMLVLAITLHNFPEGMAIGVAFGQASSPIALHHAWIVALGIGIQNIPEGLAVSLPLYRAGVPRTTAFFWGQLSGAVEPLGGLLGALAVGSCHALLAYALSFAAGAMVYVVVDDLVVEGQMSGNGRLCTWGVVIGFIVMMALDVGLG